MVVERLPCFFSFPFFFNPLSKWIEETLRVHSTHSGVAEAAATAFLASFVTNLPSFVTNLLTSFRSLSLFGWLAVSSSL